MLVENIPSNRPTYNVMDYLFNNTAFIFKVWPDNRKFIVTLCSALIAGYACSALASQSGTMVTFNTDVLDINDRSRIDLSQFSRPGYVMPGSYVMGVQINKSSLPERTILFLAPDNDPSGSEACLTPDLVEQFGLTQEAREPLTWFRNGQCLDTESLKGMSIRADLGAGILYITLPQRYQEYSAENWDPPSRWDEGINGVLTDYNVNAWFNHQAMMTARNSQTLSGSGTSGINVDAWRFRADWQTQYRHTTGQPASTHYLWAWNRYYLYRAIPALRARFTFGENYLTSDMFNSFRYRGANLISDDNMLPPNLRGYAPEVVGVAKTNARVIIRQQGQVIYDATVAAGPFRIQDIRNIAAGKLDVTVEEQDGSQQNFSTDVANTPYLSRPGLVRYKFAAGKTATAGHHSDEPGFVAGEFSVGVNNTWSLYSGVLSAGTYNALAVGSGRDLGSLGAMSFDLTESYARLMQEGTKRGKAYRLSFTRRFDTTDSQFTFSAHRFTDQNFMSMTDYLSARYQGLVKTAGSKELYSLIFSQPFREYNASAYINYTHQSSWTRPATDTWNVTISRYFDMNRFKNLSVNLTGYRTRYEYGQDKGGYISLSVPWGENGTVSLENRVIKNNNGFSASIYDRAGENNTYRVSVGAAQHNQRSFSGYLTHEGSASRITATASAQQAKYTSLSLSAQGGVTATPKGVAMHAVRMPGSTRIMLDTAGIPAIPVKDHSRVTYTNHFGKAIISDISSYYRNSFSIDLGKIGDNVEALRSVVQGTLTEGAIGYRQFGMLAGRKALATIRLPDGTMPPFGATVFNADKVQTGIVGENGETWLTGMNAGQTMNVNWEGKLRCYITLPSPLSAESGVNSLLLPCVPPKPQKTNQHLLPQQASPSQRS